MQCIVALGVEEAPRSVAEINQNGDGTACVKFPDRKGSVTDDNRSAGLEENPGRPRPRSSNRPSATDAQATLLATRGIGGAFLRLREENLSHGVDAGRDRDLSDAHRLAVPARLALTLTDGTPQKAALRLRRSRLGLRGDVPVGNDDLAADLGYRPHRLAADRRVTGTGTELTDGK